MASPTRPDFTRENSLQKSRRPSRASLACFHASAAYLDAGIEEPVDDVQQDEADHVEQGLDREGGHEDGHVVLLHGDEVEVADAGPAKDAFHDDVAGDGGKEAQHGEGHDGGHGGAQRVAEEDPPLGDTAGRAAAMT